MDTAEMRRELFGNAAESLQGQTREFPILPKRTSKQKMVHVGCWFDVWKMVKQISYEGKHILFASDIDDTVLKLCSPSWQEAIYKEFGRRPPSAKLIQPGIDIIIKDFMADINIDVIAITKRSRDRYKITSCDLVTNRIDLGSFANEISFTESELRRCEFLGKRNAYFRNIISTSSEDKGNFIVDLVKATKTSYDFIFFIDNNFDNCNNVLNVVESKTGTEVISLLYRDQSFRCTHPHDIEILKGNEVGVCSMNRSDLNTEDRDSPDFVDLR